MSGVNYQNFSEQDFICDTFFQEWVISNNEVDNQFWKEFLLNYPYKRKEVEKARAFLKNISFKEHLPSEELVQASFNKHLIAIEHAGQAKIVKIEKRQKLRTILKAAAVFSAAVLLVSAIFLFNNTTKKITIETEYGKIKTILLPDSSTIILNAHSEIKYNKHWQTGKIREVWLNGEAFFSVKHFNNNPRQIKAYEQFIVHTKDLDIEVLGTSFNVRQRRGKTEVVLQSGKIKITFKNNIHKDILMKPGDLVRYNSVEHTLMNGTTIPENYTAWKEKKLILNNPTVKQIVDYLEDTYGKKIIIEDKNLMTKKIEGPILLNDLNDALFVLSIVLNTEFIKKDSTIIIRPR